MQLLYLLILQELCHLRVKPEVDDGIDTDRGLAEHGGDGQDVEGVSGLGCVASCLCYGYAGIRKPATYEGKQLIMLGIRYLLFKF